jgi:hypothetical protein
MNFLLICMKKNLLTAVVVALLLATACAKKQSENTTTATGIENAASTADATTMESEKIPESVKKGKKYATFVASVHAAATKHPDLQTLLSNYGDYQVITMPLSETPESFVQPTTEEDAANEAQIHGYTVVNNFTFVLGSTVTLRGQQFTHLLVFDADNREVVGEFEVGGGIADAVNIYSTDTSIDKDNIITVTKRIGNLQDDNG